MNPIQFVLPTRVFGPLSDEEVRNIINRCTHFHQFRRLDNFSVLFSAPDFTIQLDFDALSSIADYPDLPPRLASYLNNLVGCISPLPKHEPEVLAAAPKPESTWIAKVRFKLNNGNTIRERFETDDLDEILERAADFPPMESIKIKLEPRI